MAELGTTRDPVALIPGSVSGVAALAQGWEQSAASASAAHDVLGGMAIPERWAGSAADAFGSYLSAVTKDSERVREAFANAAAALHAYGETLRWAQGQAAVAIELWERAAPASGIEDPVTAMAAPAAQTARAAAREQRAAAQDMLTSARHQLAAAGSTAASQVRAASIVIPARQTGTLATLVATKSATDTATNVATLLMMTARDPAAVNTWWSSLDADEKAELIEKFPALIGNLEGVDYTSRSTANEKYLDQQIADATKSLDDAVWRWDYDAAKKRLDALNGIRDAMDVDDGVPRQLISLTSDNPPLAAVSVGNMDDATNITYALPGINNSTEGNGMGNWASTAARLYDEQHRIAPPPAQHAVVAWMGYETPRDLGVWGIEKAQKGGAALDRALLGTDAVNGGATLNVVGHSYGATTSAEALSRGTAHVDSFVMLAPPGIATDIGSASELHASEVYAGENDGTWWWGTSPDHNARPTSDAFGAIELGTAGEGELKGVTDHAARADDGYGYFDRGTESLRNMAYATTGNRDRVTDDDGQ